MLKRKVSCTFKRKITLEIKERIYPLGPNEGGVMSGRMLARLALVVLLGVCAESSLRIRAQVAVPATQREKKRSGTEFPLPRLFNLPVKSDPLGIISLDLPLPYAQLSDGSPSLHVHLVVLTQDKLQIFRPLADGKLEQVFSIDRPETEKWFAADFESFPSGKYPGVQITGDYSESAKYGGFFTLAVCYVRGKFGVVFRGDEAEFVKMSNVNMPEAVQYIEMEEDTKTGGYHPTRARIWTWVGMQYKQVIDVPYEDRFSPQVLQAIKAVQEQGKTVTAPPPKAKRP